MTQTEEVRPRSVGENAAAQALIHFYRGELARSDAWRHRLDSTTNWAVATTAALLSVAFGAGEMTAGVFPLAAGLLLLFLAIESRRYRYYQVSIARVRAMEQAFIAPILALRPTDETILAALARELEAPQVRMSQGSAMAVRLWRTYTWLFLVVYIAWFVKVWIHPSRLTSLDQASERLAEGPIHGLVILAGGLALLVWISAQTARGYLLARREGNQIRGTPLRPT